MPAQSEMIIRGEVDDSANGGCFIGCADPVAI
jgi:hypothetical protein